MIKILCDDSTVCKEAGIMVMITTEVDSDKHLI